MNVFLLFTRRKFSFWVLLLACALTIGCKRDRTYYRKQADREVNCLVDQKAVVVGSDPGQFRIQVDPRSRMYDPNRPDCEPMPPDDPASHRLMNCVDCKKGSKCWKCLSRTPFVENPGWYEHLPTNEKGELVLDLPGAVQLALLESPGYQSQLENLYLSALDVSFERFRFDTQFFGNSNLLFTADGRDRSGTGGASSLFEVNPATPGTGFRARKLYATGGELVTGFANSLVWQFAGSNDYSSNTILDFSLVQPLLRAGGRTRVLERLTISERALLANVRQMERFRRGFYLNIVTGRNAGAGPSRRGGVFGGAGLEGFSGVGGGGFGGLGGGGLNFFGQGGGGGITGGAGAAGAAGYLGLLQTQQVLRNQHANVSALRESVQQLQASYEAGRIDRFQVDLAQQALYNSQSQLLTAETSYEATLENFKRDLGVPPEMKIRVSDSTLEPLNLLDPKLTALQQRVNETLDQLRSLRDQLVSGDELAAVRDDIKDKISSILDNSQQIKKNLEQQLAAVQQDLEQLEAIVPERSEDLQRLVERPEVEETHIDPELFSAEHFEERVAKRRQELAQLETQLLESWGAFEPLAAVRGERSEENLDPLIRILTNVSGQLLELSLTQAGIRLESIRFEPIELTPAQALAIASAFRRDWMNARAALVDAWRLIFFNANDLLSNLDVVFSGDIGNTTDNPFSLRDTRGRLRVGLEFDAPLTRLGERNVYRQSLIEYQQARRSYYQFRDSVYLGLRNILRQLRLNEINFELRRAAVHVAIAQVDLTQLRLYEPPKPGEAVELSNTTARDLVQALSDLLNVQNDFLSVWVNYEVQRSNLDFDLGVMELGHDGLLIENNVPRQVYLANLPYNSADMGLSIEDLEKTLPVEILSHEVIEPGRSTADEHEENAEPLPAPVAEPVFDKNAFSPIQRPTLGPLTPVYRIDIL